MAFQLYASPEAIDASPAMTIDNSSENGDNNINTSDIAASQTSAPTTLPPVSAAPSALATTTPPASRRSSTSSESSSTLSSSARKSRRPSNLSLDLSDLPPLVTPSPPSNTLIITNLHDPVLLKPSSIAHLRDLITSQLPAGSAIHSLAPLRGLKRIILSFTTTDAAIHIRALLDNSSLLTTRIRVYFGAATPLDPDNDPANPRYLKAPQAQKQFFISPPPSPPAGWEMREEGAPNRQVHAEDLMKALERRVGVGGGGGGGGADADDFAAGIPGTDAVMQDAASQAPHAAGTTTPPKRQSSNAATEAERRRKRTRSTSSAVLVYEPEELGLSPLLPMIAVEDTGAADAREGEDEDADEDENESGASYGYGYGGVVGGGEEQRGKIMAHTARPPVELMDH